MKETMDNDNRMKEGMIDRSNMKFENEYARSNPALKEIRDQAMKNARPMNPKKCIISGVGSILMRHLIMGRD